jgi:hypothetical protein
MKLNPGLSLNLGASATELKTLGLRKKLGHSIIVETNINNINRFSSRGLSTAIQWNFSF